MLVLGAQTLRYGLLGQDTYRILLTSRVTSGAELWDLLGQRLMGTHNFYRPLFTLTSALEQGLWELHPLGYQLTNLSFFAACAGLTGLLARRIAGRDARIAPLVAVGAFVLFPRHFEVLPVISRRPEMMAYAFVMLGLWLQLAPRALAARRPPLLPALALLLAAASKDNGPVLAPLFPLAVFLASPRGAAPARLQHAAWISIPHVLLVGAFLVVRSRVVVGLGGRTRETLGDLGALPGHAAQALDFLARPETTLAPTGVATALVAATALTVVAALALGREARPGARLDLHPGRLALIGALWVALIAVSYGLRGAVRSWYVFLPLGGWVLLLGGVAERLLDLAAGRLPVGRATRAAATVGLSLLVAMLLWSARTSPVVHRYPEWGVRTAALEEFYAELGRRIEAAVPGDVIECPAAPPKGERPADRPFVVQLDAVPAPAVRSWAELTYPGHPVRFFARGKARSRPRVIVVVLPE